MAKVSDVTTMAWTALTTTCEGVEEIDASDAATMAAAAAERPTPRTTFHSTESAALPPPPAATEDRATPRPTTAWSNPSVRPWHKFSSVRVQPIADQPATSTHSLHR